MELKSCYKIQLNLLKTSNAKDSLSCISHHRFL